MGQLVVRGHVLTVDDDRRVLTDGAVYVNDGRIDFLPRLEKNRAFQGPSVLR